MQDNDDLGTGDIGIGGQSVTLSGTAVHGNPVNITLLTAADGTYLFTGLVEGDYEVSYVNSSGYTPDSAQAGSTTGTSVTDEQFIDTLSLSAGEDSIDNDFGLIEL